LEFIILAKSAFYIIGLFNAYPVFPSADFLKVPKSPSRALKAPFVQTISLPNYPPGANYLRFNLLTLQTSTPGIFLKAFVNFAFVLL